MSLSVDFQLAVNALHQGEIIAYPTEGVYGLGCDPLNEKAVTRLCQIKQRQLSQGVIVIAASWEQVSPWTQDIEEQRLQTILARWPGPITWVFPASNKAPSWICGKHTSIALRITAHPVAQALCQQFGPIVSTSANVHQQSPAQDAQSVQTIFKNKIATVVAGQIGSLSGPTPIWDAVTGKQLRR